MLIAYGDRAQYAPAGSIEPGPVCQVLREVLHADDPVLHGTSSMRGGRHGHQGIVVQLKGHGARRHEPNGKMRVKWMPQVAEAGTGRNGSSPTGTTVQQKNQKKLAILRLKETNNGSTSPPL